MILKIGYETLNGKKQWDYFWDFSNLRITPFGEGMYLYDKDKDKVITQNMSGEAIELSPDFFTGLYFNKDKIENSGYATMVSFDRDGMSERFLVFADSLFLMNNDGKTVDRF